MQGPWWAGGGRLLSLFSRDLMVSTGSTTGTGYQSNGRQRVPEGDIVLCYYSDLGGMSDGAGDGVGNEVQNTDRVLD